MSEDIPSYEYGENSENTECSENAPLDEYNRVRTGKNGFPEILLSDGRIVNYVRKPKAKDTSVMHDRTAKKDNTTDKIATLLSLVITVDGKRVNMNQILETFDWDDLNLVAGEMPGNF